MKLNIPSSTSELTLGEFQTLMGTLLTNKERGEWIIKNFAKKDPELFDEKTKASVFLTTMKLFENEGGLSAEGKIGEYKLPSSLLKIRVGHFIEIVNAEPDPDSLIGADVIMGCLYRKDWDKDFSEEEIIETAKYFIEQPLSYTIAGILKMNELFETLREVYPLLYDERINKEADLEKTEDEGRRLYDMLMGLAGGKFIDWTEAKNRTVADAFVYLEELKKEKIKERLNNKNKGR